MKKFLLPFSTLFFLFFSFQNFGISQNKSIDFVLYEDATKTEYKLADMMKVIIKEREKQNTCTEFNQVPGIESAKSDYIFELWEFGESLKTSIFKEKRQRKITENNQTVVRDFMAAGVKIKAMTLFLGRLYHRSSGEIVDVFAIDGDHVKEISDDEVKNKFNPEKSNKALEDIILAKYEKEILKLRADIVKDYTQTLSSAIYSSIKTLVPPAEVTKIFEEKEGKLKKVIFNDCFEKKLNYGGFYCDLFAESSVGDKMRFVKAGSAYLTEDKKTTENILGIRDGEKELLPIMKEKKKVYALEAPVQEFFLEEPSSFPKKTFDFIILYTPGLLDNFSPAQKKYIELLFQSHFIGYRDVKVIANNPFTASINKLTNDDKKPEVDYSMGDVTKSNLIWVSVSDLKHISKRSKGFLGLEVTGGNEFYRKFALAELSTKINGKEYKYLMEIVTDKIDGFEMVLTRSLDLKEIDDNIFNNVGKIHGFVESDNKKEPFVLVESSLPYSKVKEFEVFNTTDINKKTKPIGKIKKETFLNPYLALCKIDEGKKEIMPLIEGKKELYLMGKEPKALFGLDATSVFKSDLKYYIIK